MTKTEYINNIIRDKKIPQEVVNSPLNFDFYKIYFKYSELVDELVIYKILTHKDIDNNYWKEWANDKKIFFYHILEQLTHKYEGENNDIN